LFLSFTIQTNKLEEQQQQQQEKEEKANNPTKNTETKTQPEP
jgi:hypothetical protein